MSQYSSANAMQTTVVRVTGHVQGVSFRFNTVRQARTLGVTGWVRNEADGSVRALLQGSADQIDDMLAWLGVGPAAARVDGVTIESEGAADRLYDHFQQR